MIDICAVVTEIVKAKDASDVKAFRAHTHGLVRDYGQNMLLHLAQALSPSTPEETAIVGWLQNRLVENAKQIPEFTSSKEPA